MKKTKIKIDHPQINYPCKCKTCRKTPKNCRCFEYRIMVGENSAAVYVDNVATEPARGEEVGLWQARRNAKIWRRPQFIDGYGPILWVENKSDLKEVSDDINNETFFLDNYKDRKGFRIANIEKSVQKRMPFLRKPRKKRNSVGGS